MPNLDHKIVGGTFLCLSMIELTVGWGELGPFPLGSKPELLASADPVFEFLLIEVNKLHNCNQIKPKVFQCWMIGCFHEFFLKAGVDGH